MKVLQDETLCTGCGLCAEICPVGCISMAPKEDGFLYPVKDTARCISCDKCVKSCPAVKEKPVIAPVACYAFQDGDLETRVKSASGGAASALAKAVLEAGGVYTGVRLNENMEAVHDACRLETDLDLFRDSKYVQSSTAGIFEKIQKALEEGKEVLATGTPCQIAGIRGFLKKDYENLVLCDLICHGVPSPLVFREHIRDMEQKRGKGIKAFYFRDKTHGWRKSNVKIVFVDGSEEIVTRLESDFYRLFGGNLIFRKSCHNCQFRNFQTAADLTIGDFWGIEKKYPDFAEDTGCSVVIANTPKGKAFFDRIKDKHRVLETDLDFVVETHPKLLISIHESKYRALFFKLLKPDGSGYRKAVKNLLGRDYFHKIKRVLMKGFLK